MSDLKGALENARQRITGQLQDALHDRGVEVLSDALGKCADMGLRPSEDLSKEPQRISQLRTKAEILVTLQEAPGTSGEALAEAVGMASRQALYHHLSPMQRAGLVERAGYRGWRLTEGGRLVAALLQVWADGEPLWRRLIRKHNGGIYDRAFAQRVEAAGASLDRNYAASWDGLRDRAGERVLRKATAAACIQGCKRHARWPDAARDAGIETGALEQRIKKLMKYGEVKA